MSNAKKVGTAFEHIFLSRCLASGLVAIRIPDGCRTFMSGGRPRFMRVKTPFDWVVARAGKAAAVDTKTFDTHRLGYAAIDQDQVVELQKSAAAMNAGYVVWFRPIDQVVWYSVERLRTVQPKHGLAAEEGLLLGTSHDFDPNPVLEWYDDGKSAVPQFQQRLF